MTLTEEKLGINALGFSEQYVYSPDGNMTIRCTDGLSHHYAYDGLDQLISEEGNEAISSYQHDSNYNLVQKNKMDVEINELNELIRQGSLFCTYDKCGNLVSKKSPTNSGNLPMIN